MKINELARLINGTVDGDGELQVSGVSGIATAKSGDLTFAADEARLASAEKSATCCILTHISTRKSAKCLIRVENPKLAFLTAYKFLYKPGSPAEFIDSSAVLSKSITLGKDVHIGPHVSIEDNVTIGDNTFIDSGCVIKSNCVIGKSCHLNPRVTLYSNTTLKDRVILHSGVVVGSDGFGYIRGKDAIDKFPQLGRTIIHEDVEIGANCAIDRGALGDTVIGAGGKFDNLCHIAHNVVIGRNMIMAAQSAVAGGTQIGDNVTISGQVAITDNVKIGHNVVIGAKSCVTKSVNDGAVIWGMPARALADTKRQIAAANWLARNITAVSSLLKSSNSPNRKA